MSRLSFKYLDVKNEKNKRPYRVLTSVPYNEIDSRLAPKLVIRFLARDKQIEFKKKKKTETKTEPNEKSLDIKLTKGKITGYKSNLPL